MKDSISQPRNTLNTAMSHIFILLLSMFLLSIPTQSYADLISFKETFNSRHSVKYEDDGIHHVTFDYTLWNKPLQDTLIDRFDTHLGTLNSVNINFTVAMTQPSYTTAVFRDDDWFSEVSGLMRFSVPRIMINIDGDNSLFPERLDVIMGSWSCSDTSQFSGSECSVTWTIPHAETFVYGESINLTGGDVSSFIGAGQWQIASTWGYPALILGGTWMTPGAKVTNPDDDYLKGWAVFVSLKGELGVTYDYTSTPSPVPGPATCILLGTGLVSLARFRKKMKQY
jgi:hypothetical protein